MIRFLRKLLFNEDTPQNEIDFVDNSSPVIIEKEYIKTDIEKLIDEFNNSSTELKKQCLEITNLCNNIALDKSNNITHTTLTDNNILENTIIETKPKKIEEQLVNENLVEKTKLVDEIVILEDKKDVNLLEDKLVSKKKHKKNRKNRH